MARKGATVEVDGDSVRERYENNPKAEFTDLEIRWMQDQGISKEGEFAAQPVTFRLPDGTVVSNDPTYFATLQVQNQTAFEQLVSEKAKELAKQMVISEQMSVGAQTEYQGTATGEPRGGGAVSSPPDNSHATKGDVPPYEEWKVPELRAELSSRNLSIEGTKAELINRLESDDAGVEE